MKVNDKILFHLINTNHEQKENNRKLKNIKKYLFLLAKKENEKIEK